ncbi:MAG: integrin alpha [Planctomycetes bacterium]|nr:integrin alpha [Planctomycetota bacterium]
MKVQQPPTRSSSRSVGLRVGLPILLLLQVTGRVPAQGTVLWQAGGAGFDSFGASLANLGDVDADGVPDFVIGAPQAATLGVNAGSARVVSGATGSALLTVIGAGPGDRFGASVAATGDLDGDGVADFIVGASEEGSPPGTGYARVLSGATGALLFVLPGSLPGEKFGWSTAGPGDLDADGIPDLLVGAPQAFLSGPGGAVAFSGANGSVLLNLSGAAVADWFGYALAAAGDADGDGVPDLLVGAPFADPPGILSGGRAYLLSGANGAPLLTLDGATSQERFGASVAATADLDGDAVTDLLVGAPRYPSGNGPGRARVFSVTSGASLFTLGGTLPNGGFGTSVGPAGDVNADGMDDVLVGGLEDFGFSAGGECRVFSGVGGVPLMSLVSSLSQFGAAVAGAGDLNADGYGDFLVGAPALPPPYYGAGWVRAFSFDGIPPGSTLYGSGCPGSGGITPEIRALGLPTSAVGSPAFGILLSRALGGTTAVLVVGFSFQAWGTIPLPLDLGPLGAPGCALFASADMLLPTSTGGSGPGSGTASVPLPIPPNSTLVGSIVHFQWYVADPGPLVVPGAMSQALQILTF